jgi:hypothetical protein
MVVPSIADIARFFFISDPWLTNDGSNNRSGRSDKKPLNVNRRMSGIDHLRLDGNLLQFFVAVMETGSISNAAERLNLSQSAVSHQVEKLRAIVGDPLLVKSGRGIVATARAMLGGAGAGATRST